jgi:hypothetical protein
LTRAEIDEPGRTKVGMSVKDPVIVIIIINPIITVSITIAVSRHARVIVGECPTGDLILIRETIRVSVIITRVANVISIDIILIRVGDKRTVI